MLRRQQATPCSIPPGRRAHGELRTTSAGFPATRVVGCGETHSRVLAICAASSPDTVCRETVARQPTREPLASLTVMVEMGVAVGKLDSGAKRIVCRTGVEVSFGHTPSCRPDQGVS